MSHDDSDSNEEDDTVDTILPPPPVTMRQRNSVSAEAFGVWNQRAPFVAPVFPKGDDEKEEIKVVMQRSFLFSSLDKQATEVVALAFKGPMVLSPGHLIIQEGDQGEHLYIVTKGSFDCFKQVSGVNTVVKTCVKGDLFGELALLYNCPRAASVVSKEDSVVYELDRLTFNNIVLESVEKKRAACIRVLQTIPLFTGVTQCQLESICDSLKQEEMTQGTVITLQGDVGRHFFIVHEGTVLATRTPPEGGSPIQMTHQAGDYFGEVALLKNQPRMATVIAYTPEVKLLSMDSSTFKRLMGPAEQLLQSGLSRYA